MSVHGSLRKALKQAITAVDMDADPPKPDPTGKSELIESSNPYLGFTTYRIDEPVLKHSFVIWHRLNQRQIE